MNALIDKFIGAVSKGYVEVYNEISLQHELGFFLRSYLPKHKVQFERNVSYFFPNKKIFTKREIDISIFSPDKRDLKHVFELKFPRNGQYPEQMYSFCKDIAFIEELKESGFRQAHLIIFADDHLFYEGITEGIYGFFRGGIALHGTVQKPTGKKDTNVFIKGRYNVRWSSIIDHLKYTLIEAN